ncbi:isochorismatase family protein [Stenotrophomonas sp. MYb238]|uniref:isochorismatase family protein n=1 Tax=Stenotrophomonas sp. MYb238 TaxID=2040281 RepID=UPI001D17B69F|nr:isochorismatase family protein [Stenotrophomonas sp. MYb238]
MPAMETSSLTARQYWEQVKANPNRARFGFGRRPAIVNIDVQRAYTDLAAFRTAYETDPRQIEHINALSAQVRALGLPVVWTYVAYLESGEDAGVWGTRTDTPDSLQNIKHGSERAQFDQRAEVRPGDIVMHKRMASPFFETNLWSLLTFHRIDTLIVTGGSTSGCVRACVIDSLSRGYRTIVPEQCVADKHEIPHFANLCDIMLKYGDVEDVDAVAAQLQALRA